MDNYLSDLDFTVQAMMQWRSFQDQGAILIKNNPASKRFSLRGRIG